MTSFSNRLRHGSIVAALDVGSSKIGCLIAEVAAAADDPLSAARSRVIGIGYHRSQGVKSGMVFDPAAAELAIRRAVDRAERQADLSLDRLSIVVNSGRLRSLNFAAELDVVGGNVTSAHVERLLRRGWSHVSQLPEAILHAMPVGFTLDKVHRFDDPVGRSGERLRADFHALIVDREPVRRLLGCVEDSYLSPASVVAGPYASALAVLRPRERQEGAVVLDLGGGTSAAAVIAADHLIHTASISKGGAQITSALAREFSLDWREAERWKLHLGRRNPAVADRVPGDRVSAENMAGERVVAGQLASILMHLKERLAASGFALGAARYVVLTGGSALYHDAPRIAAEIFGLPTRVGVPIAVAGLPRELASPVFASLWGAVVEVSRKHRELASRFAAEDDAERGSLTRIGGWLHHLGQA